MVKDKPQFSIPVHLAAQQGGPASSSAPAPAPAPAHAPAPAQAPAAIEMPPPRPMARIPSGTSPQPSRAHHAQTPSQGYSEFVPRTKRSTASKFARRWRRHKSSVVAHHDEPRAIAFNGTFEPQPCEGGTWEHARPHPRHSATFLTSCFDRLGCAVWGAKDANALLSPRQKEGRGELLTALTGPVHEGRYVVELAWSFAGKYVLSSSRNGKLLVHSSKALFPHLGADNLPPMAGADLKPLQEYTVNSLLFPDRGMEDGVGHGETDEYVSRIVLLRGPSRERGRVGGTGFEDTDTGGLYLVCARTHVLLCEMQDGGKLVKIDEFPTKVSVRSVVVCPTTTVFAVGGSDGSIVLLQLTNNKIATIASVPRAHGGPISCLSFHFSDFGLLISAAEDRMMKAWRLVLGSAGSGTGGSGGSGGASEFTFECLTHIKDETSGDIHLIRFHPTRSMFCTVSNDHFIRYWSTSSFQLLGQIRGAHTSTVSAAEFTPDGLQLMTVGRDNKWRFWSTTQFVKIVHSYGLNDSYVLSLCALKSANGAPVVLAGSVNGRLNFWNFDAQGAIMSALPRQIHSGTVWSVVASHDGKFLVTVSSSEEGVQVWTRSKDNEYSRSQITAYESDEGRGSVSALATPRGRPGSGSLRAIIPPELESSAKHFYYCAEFQPTEFHSHGEDAVFQGGERVVGWVTGGMVSRADVAQPEVCAWTLRGATLKKVSLDMGNFASGNMVRCIAFNDHGTLAVVGEMFGGFLVWHSIPPLHQLTSSHLASHSVRCGTNQHTGQLRGVTFLSDSRFPDRERFVTLSNDQTAKIWQVELGDGNVTLQLVQVLSHRGALRGACYWEPLLFTASDCDGIKAWHNLECGGAGDDEDDEEEGVLELPQHLAPFEAPLATAPGVSVVGGDSGQGESELEDKGHEGKGHEGKGHKHEHDKGHKHKHDKEHKHKHEHKEKGHRHKHDDKEHKDEDKGHRQGSRLSVKSREDVVDEDDEDEEFVLVLEIEEPCNALALFEDMLYSAHGNRVLAWDLNVVASLNAQLQPITGKTDKSLAASVIPLPHPSAFSSHFKEGRRARRPNPKRTWWWQRGAKAARASNETAPGEEEEEEGEDDNDNEEDELNGDNDPQTPAQPARDDQHANSVQNKFVISDGEQREADIEVPMVHIAFAQAGDDARYDSELHQLFESVPWLCGLFLHSIAGISEGTLNAHALRVLSTLASSCHNTKQLFLAPDPSCEWDVVSKKKLGHDGLVHALHRGNMVLVEFVLFELLQKLWLHRSLALIFTVEHLRLLIERFPHLVYPFLRPQTREGVFTELCIERSPPYVMGQCDRKPAGKYVIRGSFGMEPHCFWEEQLENNKQFQSTNVVHKDVDAFRVGIKGLVAGGREVLKAADSVAEPEVRNSIFSLTSLDAVIRYQVHENRTITSFRVFLLLHFLTVLAMAVFSLFVASHDVSSSDFVLAVLLAIYLVCVNLYWLSREAKQVRDLGFREYVRDVWNWIDCYTIVSTIVIVIGFFAGWKSRFSLAAVTVVFYWFKLVFYMRMFESFAFLVRALFQICSDLKAFFTILCLTMFGFANAFYVLYQENRSFNWDDYEVDFGTKTLSVLSAFSMMLGGFDILVIRDAGIGNTQILAMILFAVYMLFVFVVMLNVIIAIISNTFTEVQKTKRIEFRAERASMVVEYTQLQSPSMKRQQLRSWMQLLSSGNDIIDNRRTALETNLQAGRQPPTPVPLHLRAERSSSHLTMPPTKALQVPGLLPEPSEYALELERRFRKQVPVVRLPGLPTFGLVPAPVQLTVRSLRAGVYEVDEMSSHPFLRHLDEIGILNTGQFSNPSPLGHAGKSRAELHMPSKATHFGAAFPLGGVGHLQHTYKNNLALVDSSFTFLLFGGMVTFNHDRSAILSAHSFLPGGTDMKFEERRPWDRRFTPLLHAQRRLHAITIKELREEGTELFTWIAPGEVLKNEEGLVWTDWEFGAFVYLFHKDPLALENSGHDCYFPVSDDCPFSRSLKATNNEALVAVNKAFAERKQRLEE